MEEVFKKIEHLPRAIELAQNLEETDDVERIKMGLGELLNQIEQDLGIKFVNQSYAVFEEFRKKECLVRVDTLTRILTAVETDQEIEISPEDDNHYANAVVPLTEGIKIAFSEGSAPGPVRVAIGFGKTLVGFKTSRISVKAIDFNPDDPRGAEERGFLCRHVDGKIKREDIVGFVIRIPRTMMKEENLFPDEIGGKSPFIFRCINFIKGE